MLASHFKRRFVATALLLLIGSAVQAESLWVNCAGKNGLTSIGAALKALELSKSQDWATINVSGPCHENIVIKEFNFLTIAGSNGASVTDASEGAADVVDIRNSRVTINGLTIDGLSSVNGDAVDCEQGSQCTLIGNTIVGGADGVGVFGLSSTLIVGGTINDATGDGILAIGDVVADGVAVQGNPVGVVIRRGGRATLGVGDPAYVPIRAVAQTTIANNATGIVLSEGAQLSCGACRVHDNAGDGVHIDVSATALFGAVTLSNGTILLPAVTRNSGHGIVVGDLSSATFQGASTVTGNGQRDISCTSPTSVTRGALPATGGGGSSTNCTN